VLRSTRQDGPNTEIEPVKTAEPPGHPPVRHRADMLVAGQLDQLPAQNAISFLNGVRKFDSCRGHRRALELAGEAVVAAKTRQESTAVLTASAASTRPSGWQPQWRNLARARFRRRRRPVNTSADAQQAQRVIGLTREYQSMLVIWPSS
jgi:hypothetical protein